MEERKHSAESVWATPQGLDRRLKIENVDYSQRQICVEALRQDSQEDDGNPVDVVNRCYRKSSYDYPA